MGDLQRTFSAGGHTLLAARALIADDSVSGRASITDLASDTQAEDFHVVELNQSGAIVAHFTHPEHCAMVVGAGARPFAAPPLHALALTACIPPVPSSDPQSCAKSSSSSRSGWASTWADSPQSGGNVLPLLALRARLLTPA